MGRKRTIGLNPNINGQMIISNYELDFKLQEQKNQYGNHNECVTLKLSLGLDGIMKENEFVILIKSYNDLKPGTKGRIRLKVNNNIFDVEFYDLKNNIIGTYRVPKYYLRKIDIL